MNMDVFNEYTRILTLDAVGVWKFQIRNLLF